jgi:hypothetical protein
VVLGQHKRSVIPAMRLPVGRDALVATATLQMEEKPLAEPATVPADMAE